MFLALIFTSASPFGFAVSVTTYLEEANDIV